jgi:hypothetical protein
MTGIQFQYFHFEKWNPIPKSLDEAPGERAGQRERLARREEAPLITATDGMQTLRATMAVHQAASSGQTVVLEQDDAL